MCLGIPGQLVELPSGHEHLARVDVSGVTRVVNIGLLEDERLRPGDWVLIHVGFALSKIDEEEANLALEGLRLMGQAYTDEMDAFRSSTISSAAAPAMPAPPDPSAPAT
jgi:hydrogenase expression/formation protein HypC